MVVSPFLGRVDGITSISDILATEELLRDLPCDFARVSDIFVCDWSKVPSEEWMYMIAGWDRHESMRMRLKTCVVE